jgi:hypothetical protein
LEERPDRFHLVGPEGEPQLGLSPTHDRRWLGRLLDGVPKR